MQIGEVTQIWRYPAKGMVGQRVDRGTYDELGMIGDRLWAVRDEGRQSIQGGRKLVGINLLDARYTNEPTERTTPPPIVITLPGGTTLDSDDPTTNEQLSKFFGRPVSLWPLQPTTNLDHYRRGLPDYPDDIEREVREILAREPDEPLPDFSIFPAEHRGFETPPGAHYDSFPLLIVSEQMLQRIAELAPASIVDVRRFRPNLVVSLPDTGHDFPEMSLVGTRIDVGSTTIEVVAPCPRCAVITREFPGLPLDRALMRTVVKHADQNVGVYARVTQQGTVAMGDTVRVNES